MTRDTVDPDPVVDRKVRLGRVAVGASCPGGGARLPPHGMGLEDLPGPFPLVVAPRVIAQAMTAVGGLVSGLLGITGVRIIRAVRLAVAASCEGSAVRLPALCELVQALLIRYAGNERPCSEKTRRSCHFRRPI